MRALIVLLASLAASVGLTVVASVQPAQLLGDVTFPTSGAPQAQQRFLTGVKWLHSMGYEEAIEAFRDAQRLDPAFAMAYWGEALCYDQPLWFNENAAAARAALARLGPTADARRAKAPTDREKAYLRSVDALFGAGDAASRHRAYAAQMSSIASAYPTDDEAAAFSALAILGTLPRGDAALPLREQAGALVERVFARNPRHPGAAHYILHAYDHRALVRKAARAATAYARIAPASSHARHMPAHAFLQLGMWSEASAADESSYKASVAWAQARKASVAMYDFHSLTWLQYEQLQQGRFEAARQAIRTIEEAMRVIGPQEQAGGHHYGDSEIGRGSGPSTLRNHRGSLRARWIVESEQCDEMKGQATFDNVDELFALGWCSARLGDTARAEAALAHLQTAAASGDAELKEQAAVMAKELDGLVHLRRGRQAQGLASLEQAVVLQDAMPKPIGRPYPVKPAHELIGEVLLEMDKPREAADQFRRALDRSANRSRSVIGLARAQRRLGDAAAAALQYTQFLKNWRTASPELAEVKEANRNMAK